jgi:hypothetical protein
MLIQRLCLCLGLMATSTAHADTGVFISDAFGLVPQERYTGSLREDWAGRLEILTGAQLSPAWSHADRVANKLLFFVGPKSARAGEDRVHGVALAVDEAGNLVPDGLTTRFQPGSGSRRSAKTSGGIAEILFRPPVQAGMYHAGAMLGGVQSARADYRVVPDLDSVDLVLGGTGRVLHQETLDRLVSQPIADRFGNPVEAGVTVGLLLSHADGAVSRLEGVTTGNAASLPILVRGLASDVSARLSLGPVLSPSVPFDLRKVTLKSAPPVVWSDLPEIGGMRVRAGPFVTNAGHLLNDGSAVTLSLQFSDGSTKTAQGWIKDGTFEAIVAAGPDLLPAQVRIEAGDSVARARLGNADLATELAKGWTE